MAVDSNLYSVQLERAALGGLLNNQELLIEFNHLTDKDFYEKTHSLIFNVLKNLVLSGNKVDKVILAQKIKELGIKSYGGDIDIFTYLDDLSFTKINKNGIEETIKELINLRISREICSNADSVKNFVIKNRTLSTDKLISGADTIYNGLIDSYQIENQPIDLYQGIEPFIYGKAENPEEEVGLITPFKKYNQIYGGLQSSAGVYAVVARPKQFKSTFLQNMAEGVVQLNPDTKALVLDTELTDEIMKLRASSSATQVPYWYLNSGNWVKNKELADKVKNNISKLKSLQGKVYHMSVPDKSIEDICSIIRRWYFSICGRGQKAVIIYDYIKVSGEPVSSNNTEYMIVGNKINALNKIAKDLGIVVWTACQLNRTGEGKFSVDDGSAIALSDRLAWYAAFVGIFRKKRAEELQEDGAQFGSHKLIPLYSRFGGRDFNAMDLIKVRNKNGKYEYRSNFLNYNIENFKVSEHGDLRDIITQNSLSAPLQNDSHANPDNTTI